MGGVVQTRIGGYVTRSGSYLCEEAEELFPKSECAEERVC